MEMSTRRSTRIKHKQETTAAEAEAEEAAEKEEEEAQAAPSSGGRKRTPTRRLVETDKNDGGTASPRKGRGGKRKKAKGKRPGSVSPASSAAAAAPDINPEDIQCFLCSRDDYSDESLYPVGSRKHDPCNQILLCDSPNCKAAAYHQRCHFIPLFVIPRGTWICLLCRYEEQKVKKPARVKGQRKSKGNPQTELIQLLDEFDHKAKGLKADYTFEVLQHLSKSLGQSISQIRAAENIMRTYTETEKSRRSVIALFPRVPSELMQAKTNFARSKVRIRHQLLSLKRYIEDRPPRPEPRFDSPDAQSDEGSDPWLEQGKSIALSPKKSEEDTGVPKRVKRQSTSGAAEADDNGDPVDSTDIVCCVCHSGHSTEDNDVIMCDGKKCFRAFHMKCLRPNLTKEVLKSLRPESDTWFCPFCTKLATFMHYVQEEYYGDDGYSTDWDEPEDVFPEAIREYQDSLLLKDGKGTLTALLGDHMESSSDDADSDDEDDEESTDEDFDPNKKDTDESSTDSDGSMSDEGDSDKLDEELAALSDADEDSDGSGLKSRRKTDSTPSQKPEGDIGALDKKNIVAGKRKRKKVDYLKLNALMFGDDADKKTGDESDDNAEWAPTLDLTKAPGEEQTGGSESKRPAKVRRTDDDVDDSVKGLSERLLGLAHELNQQKAYKKNRAERSADKCTCTRSRCLKKYCVCYASKMNCTDKCTCLDCGNCRPANVPSAAPTKEGLSLACEETIDNTTTVKKETTATTPGAEDAKAVVPEGKDSDIAEKPAAEQEKNDSQVFCKCPKSRCLKKYCQCFSRGLQCNSGCTCVECHNWPGGARPVVGGEKTIKHVLLSAEKADDGNNYAGVATEKKSKANPVPRLERIDAPMVCSCKKSRCLKMYCVCFANKRRCSGECQCADCSNTDERDPANSMPKSPKARPRGVVAESSTEVKSPSSKHASSPKVDAKPDLSLSGSTTSTKVGSAVLSAEASAGGKVDVGTNAKTSGSGNQEAPKLTQGNNSLYPIVCSCKHSRCNKKYCVCYASERPCSEQCQCAECKNVHGFSQSDSGKVKDSKLPILLPKPSASAGKSAGDGQLGNTSVKMRPNAPTVCTCRKSRCIKLYCVCFANNRHCTKDCQCNDCSNTQEKIDSLRAGAQRPAEMFKQAPQSLPSPGKASAKERGAAGMPSSGSVNVAAASQKPLKRDDTSEKNRKKKQAVEGPTHCSCKNSRCLKLYCVCYERSRRCSEDCRCEGCMNKTCPEGCRCTFCLKAKKESETVTEKPAATLSPVLPSSTSAFGEAQGMRKDAAKYARPTGMSPGRSPSSLSPAGPPPSMSPGRPAFAGGYMGPGDMRFVMGRPPPPLLPGHPVPGFVHPGVPAPHHPFAVAHRPGGAGIHPLGPHHPHPVGRVNGPMPPIQGAPGTALGRQGAQGAKVAQVAQVTKVAQVAQGAKVATGTQEAKSAPGGPTAPSGASNKTDQSQQKK